MNHVNSPKAHGSMYSSRGHSVSSMQSHGHFQANDTTFRIIVMLIAFNEGKDSQKVMGRVSCQIDSLNLTLPGVAYDMCGKYANCPVKANEIFTANVEVPILKLYPSVSRIAMRAGARFP